ncbi:DUF1521 domain-containing protein [Caballeronia sp. LZ035]|uniref:DUF1521 domain-containing protein n=1 Tax=Caballeronia sp. LZ035 TaxID=3038568 RepID=UPI00285E718F|nr:DUF1521 domain-containing protein [Caballeronia sp. LZ035]MDR5760164.1 DUF1521 domain-containing protein [Caballeronia sp. LZ035]
MPAPMSPFSGGGYQTSSYNNFSQQTYSDPSSYYQSMSSSNYYSLNSPMGSMSSFQSFNSMFANQAPQGSNGGSNFSYSDFQRSTSMNSYQCPPTPPAPPTQSAWSDTGVNNNQSSIDLGQYKLDLDKAHSSMMLTDKTNNIATKVWGDPHIDFNSGSGNQTSGMFNGSLTFDLPDNTTIGVHTQPIDGGVSLADSLTITRGNQAYNVTGLSEQNPAPLSVERSNNGFAAWQNQPQDGPHLMATNSGTGWVNEQTHQMAKASDFNA